MILHVCVNFSGMIGSLEHYIALLEMEIQMVRQNADGRPIPWGDLPPNVKQGLQMFVAAYAVQECKPLGLHISEQKASRLERELRSNQPYTPEVMLKELRGLKETIVMELAPRKFAYIPPPDDKFFEQEQLFGDEVYDNFPSAREEIKDAGNCLASGLHTATVFHLMRVAEIGLRILARDRRVKIKVKLDYAEWQTIIDGIQKKVDAMSQAKRGPKRAAALEFYRGILGEFSAFKDVFRNHVMHSRVRYDEGKARSAMQHVSEFMKRLATRLSESNIKPLAWRL
jgi:hypothetical protein